MLSWAAIIMLRITLHWRKWIIATMLFTVTSAKHIEHQISTTNLLLLPALTLLLSRAMHATDATATLLVVTTQSIL
jgi:hypothetical protein